MATVVEASGAPPLPVISAVVEEGRTVMETTTPQAALEPPAGSDPSGTDVVMVPADDDSVLPPLAGDRDVVTSTVPKCLLATGAVSVEDAMDLVACRYVDFPGIGTIDLDTPELPSNDREMLEVATDRIFAEPSILDTIASVASALRQYEGAGGSALPAASEAAEGVLKESTAGIESTVVVSLPSLDREGMGASLP
jgi:hypothetical protein